MNRRERFLRRVRLAESGCWLCINAPNPVNGYTRYDNKLAHRVAYELWIGPIPAGLVVNHKCRVPACVNPAHLEAVTQAENIRYSRAILGNWGLFSQAERTHCKNGHLLSGDNLLPNYGRRRGRTCKTCHTAQRLRSDRKRRALLQIEIRTS